MNPSTPLASSRFATFLLHLALAPLQNMELPVARTLAPGLGLAHPLPESPLESVPTGGHGGIVSSHPHRQKRVARPRPGPGRHASPAPPWPFLGQPPLYRIQGKRPPAETEIPGRNLHPSGGLLPLDPFSTRPNHRTLLRDRAACHPLLPLLLFCQAFGPDLPRKPLHDYLLRRNRKTGTWNNPTETALTLLCLLSTGYQGPELSLAVEKLIRSQEPDGSWPPNSLYEQANLFYGSRELTTAWCLLALFLYHLGPCLPATRENPLEGSKPAGTKSGRLSCTRTCPVGLTASPGPS